MCGRVCWGRSKVHWVAAAWVDKRAAFVAEAGAGVGQRGGSGGCGLVAQHLAAAAADVDHTAVEARLLGLQPGWLRL